MKLLVHNLLSSKFLKGVQVGYPLKLNATKVEIKEQDFNAEFIKRMIPKLDWSGLKVAADSVGAGEKIPGEADPVLDNNEEFLKVLHHVLFEIEVVEGNLECPETGRQFNIRNGIPNMLANEDEV